MDNHVLQLAKITASAEGEEQCSLVLKKAETPAFMTVQLHLPYPPSANRLWVRAKKGMRKSDEYERWLHQAGLHIMTQRPKKIDGPYKLMIHATRPDKRARDIDNLIKSVGDVLQIMRVVKNDSDCEMVTARWVTFGEGVTVFVDRAGMEEV